MRQNTSVMKGLSEIEAEKRFKQKPNILKSAPKRGLILRFIDQFRDFMVILLLLAAVVSAVLSYLGGENDYIDSAVIVFIVVLNATIGVVQEGRSARSLEALKKIAAPHVRVRRDGKICVVRTEKVVVGDVLVFSAGEYIPADAKIVSGTEVECGEAILTGESIGVAKTAGKSGDAGMLFAGCSVLHGNGEAIVEKIGSDTKMGSIARMLDESAPVTPLQKRLAHAGKIMGIGALVICGLIFALGVISGKPALDMLLLAVSLAVAAIPEGLPAVVTIVLAYGVQKLLQNKAIVKKLPAVETLGCATVICSDKTGTLTRNEQTLTHLADENGEIDFKNGKRIFEAFLLCSDCTFENGVLNGSEVETAVLKAALKLNIDIEGIRRKNPRIHSTPFDSSRKYMMTEHIGTNGKFSVIKGAPEVVLEKCASKRGEKTVALLTSRGIRVLAVARTANSDKREQFELVGFVGMSDPIREEAERAIIKCKAAGIKTIMLTGDNELTAKSVAMRLGIEGNVISGLQGRGGLDVENFGVFARVTPEDKLNIVKALQRRGEVVAMTGDGVNDAPALQLADIGCAMGSGCEVAKESADIILVENNFETIVAAVEQGRGIYDNIRKALHFLLSSNIGEIIVILAAFIFGLPSPLAPMQLLWVNLVTDSLPALALGKEAISPDIMLRKPIKKNSSIFAGGMGFKIITEGVIIGLLALLAFTVGRLKYSLPTGMTMTFCVLSLSQLVHSFNMRSEHSVIALGIFSNKALTLSFIICSLLQISVVLLPGLNGLFKTVQMDAFCWITVGLLSLAPLIICEIQKLCLKE